MRISDWSSDVCSSDLDRVGYDQVVFEAIAADYRQLAAQLGISHVACIPVSALQGDNLLRESPQMPWYRGASLLRHLEDIVVRQAPAERSEEHTSELQSLMRISYAVFCLKKKNINKTYAPQMMQQTRYN